MTAVRHNPLLKKLYGRVFEATKVKMKGYVAVQRKMLVLIYTLYKGQVPFDAEFSSVKKNRAVAEKNQAGALPCLM